ncbi:hypothetical protein CKAH01_18961 [Colletotrichum kahawae]|uniref:Uncharacterized protein n=1 Tax=Colletotrichum kahawae TaxID=34407 RepID=A0AAE0D103_COLKA|nr:hypothetical protein CKAH01_18961 [Colletotrichum kahawae]
MVKFTASIVALALAVTAAAAPTSQTTFSFAQWVEDIIATPDTALSPEEAVAAANAADVVTSAGGLIKRAARCQQLFKDAPAGDAAACLDDLARKGAQGVQCGLSTFDIQMCRIGGAQLVASKGGTIPLSANCNDVARTGGLIFDSCWRADDTVRGTENCITNREMFIHITGV